MKNEAGNIRVHGTRTAKLGFLSRLGNQSTHAHKGNKNWGR